MTLKAREEYFVRNAEEKSCVLSAGKSSQPEINKEKRRHPFGTVKRHLTGYYFLLKGKLKAESETALLYMAYNMRRAINMVGVS